jgi:hypothetical protein
LLSRAAEASPAANGPVNLAGRAQLILQVSLICICLSLSSLSPARY